jgi:FAD/FMN-containing dehydrogenase
MRYQSRKTWSNHTGNQRVEPLRIYRPTTLADVTSIVREAEAAGTTVRAVGSHHSWSDVAVGTGYVIETRELCRVLDLERPLLVPERIEALEQDGHRLVRVEAGMRLRELNAALDRMGLALSNMGGYDEQTVAGVMGTSTHGSGLRFGPIASFVRSIDIVASGATLYRIEPAHGITDAERYAAGYADRRLVQDDDWFQSVAVSMGCLGVIWAVIIEVEPAYWLKEIRTLSTWSQVREDLRTRRVLATHRHYEVYFNPHPTRGGDHTCLVTTRDLTTEPLGKPTARRRRNLVAEIAAGLPFVPKLLNLLFDIRPAITPGLLDRSLEALVDDEYCDRSFRVLNVGTANLLPAYSSEIGVPVDDRQLHIKAVERILAIAARQRALGNVYHTSPTSLRFVRRSEAYMSMMYGVDTMMIELILTTDTEGGLELLAAYEEALYEVCGRPHWGQINTLTGSHELVRSMYPMYDRWIAVHQRLNASRVFDSPFAKRVGISASRWHATSPIAAAAQGRSGGP